MHSLSIPGRVDAERQPGLSPDERFEAATRNLECRLGVRIDRSNPMMLALVRIAIVSFAELNLQ